MGWRSGDPQGRRAMANRIVTSVARSAVVILLAAALWLRVAALGSIPELNADEAWFGAQVGRALRGEPFATRTYSGNPLNPFFSGMIAPLMAAFGPSTWVVRAPAVACGVLAIV